MTISSSRSLSPSLSITTLHEATLIHSRRIRGVAHINRILLQELLPLLHVVVVLVEAGICIFYDEGIQHRY